MTSAGELVVFFGGVSSDTVGLCTDESAFDQYYYPNMPCSAMSYNKSFQSLFNTQIASNISKFKVTNMLT